jgi:AbrB family looped-hinge helix DNA binding protein
LILSLSESLLGYILTLTSKSIYFGGFMRVTSKGQVTIPQEIRDKYGFLPQTEVTFVEEGERVYLVKQPDTTTTGRGQRLIAQLRGRATVHMTTEEILALTRGEA